MNRPVSGSDFGFQIPLKEGLHTITDGAEYDEDYQQKQQQIQQQLSLQHESENSTCQNDNNLKLVFNLYCTMSIRF